MEFVNRTPFDAAWFLGFQPDGRELMIVAVKATYAIPPAGGEPVVAELQAPLVKADEFTGEPGASATRRESDFAHHKPACDVLVNGSAHAPNGRPAEKVAVSLRIGPIQKRFDVVGDRTWNGALLGSRHTAPERFRQLPISYDRAYGGTDREDKEGGKVRAYAANPVGAGYYPLSRGRELAGKPLANTQELGRPATGREGNYRPMSFGPIGRNFPERVRYAGTYDQRWTEERAPWFPADFDYRYFQCAPEDQRMPYPAGGEEVELENLSPEGRLRFRLPRQEVPVLFVPHAGPPLERLAAVDTVLIEPDDRLVALTARASLALTKSCFDLKRIVVGRTVTEHLKETRQSGKPRYGNLAELVRAQALGRRR